MKRFALSLFTGILMSAVGQFSFADGKGRPILDQFNTGVQDSSINGGTSNYEWQQGVTVGISGQLTRIDLFVEIYPGLGETVPTQLSVSEGPPWQSGAPVWTVTAVLVPGWNTFDIKKQKIFVETGDEFVIGIHGESASNFNPGMVISYGDQYPGGDLYLNGSLNSEVNDILFRTYVKQRPRKGN